VADEHLRGRVPAQGHDSREGNTYGVRSRDATTTKGQAGEAAQLLRFYLTGRRTYIMDTYPKT
jgi:hypothetical protein